MPRYNEVAILRTSLSFYRANPVLLIPILLSIPFNILMTIAISNINQHVLKLDLSWMMSTSYFELLPILFASLFIGFLVTLGLVKMASKIVTRGRCGLSNWIEGIREYFWRILALTIVFTALPLLVAIATGLALGYASVYTGLILKLPPEITGTISKILLSIYTLAMYTCYAAITIDDAGLRASISLGLKTVRESARVFLVFCLIYTAISSSRALFEGNLWNTDTIQPMLFGLSIGYDVAVSFLYPLWILIMFTIYRKFSPKVKKDN